MVSLACSATEENGVTLVTARIQGSTADRRVRLENRLDGPVWPPRTRGIPAAGWDDSGLDCVVPATETVAVGYASPAPPADPPVELAESEVVDADATQVATPEATAVRDLGDPSPPRDALPTPNDQPETPDSRRDDTTLRKSGPAPSTRRPDAVAAWLDRVEDRLATTERLAAAQSVPEATAALREAGGLAAAESLVADLDEDVRDLERVGNRAQRLADRAAAADVPLATLERIA